MKDLREDFKDRELLYWKLISFAFVINIITLVILFILQGDVPIELIVLPIVTGLFHVVTFVILIYRTYIFYTSKKDESIQIWRSITGVALSPLGLLFSFFNYAIIGLANLW